MTKKKHGWYEGGKIRVNISLTPTSIESLDRQATRLGMSRSELIETMARQDQSLLPEEKQVLGKLSAG